MYYVLLLAILLIIYVLSNSVFGFLSPLSYILLVYIAALDKINDKNYIWFAFLFGLFSDFVRGGYFGPGVLLFLFYGVLTLKAGVFFDMDKFFSKFAFRFSLIAFDVFFNMAMNNYLQTSFVSAYIFYLLINLLALILLIFFTEVTGAFKGAERRSSGVL